MQQKSKFEVFMHKNAKILCRKANSKVKSTCRCLYRLQDEYARSFLQNQCILL